MTWADAISALTEAIRLKKAQCVRRNAFFVQTHLLELQRVDPPGLGRFHQTEQALLHNISTTDSPAVLFSEAAKLVQTVRMHLLARTRY